MERTILRGFERRLPKAGRPVEPLGVDRWIASSLMQKAIRRGEAELAERAAVTLLKGARSKVWRRLVLTAFEDVGAASVDAVVTTVAAATDAKWRTGVGGDTPVVAALARLQADAPKNRSADYLICAARDHPSLERTRARLARGTASKRLELIADRTQPLPARATAAWYASGISECGGGRGDLDRLLAILSDLGAPRDLVTATEAATARCRDPIVVMVPLVHLAVEASPIRRAVRCGVPDAPVINGVPLYTFDMHTRVGRRAILRFATENTEVRACLELYVPASGRTRAILNAAFHADAAPVALRLDWDQSESLQALGIENDLLVAGSSPEGIEPLMASVRNNLPHLNEIRARLFALSQGPGTEYRGPAP